MDFIIPTRFLKAASLAVAKKDSRQYLHGVHFNNTNGKLRIESTDGCQLFIVTLDDENDAPDVKFIIPETALKQLPKTPSLQVSFDPVTNKVTVGIVTVSAIDGKFPDVNRIIPTNNASNELADFDWDRVALGQKVLRLVDGKTSNVYKLQFDGVNIGRMTNRTGKAAFYIMPLIIK